ncbi:hypothetical protein [Pelagibius sp. Alg239-R121]|uniref:hypothetical protein n=1 Tax=Pelagibius sp. Alg239-R121 TaxID=2993448 RepID=UPI0024A71F19|nr:hypothetical protein [Pelagibius sp. Alg239-R121]
MAFALIVGGGGESHAVPLTFSFKGMFDATVSGLGPNPFNLTTGDMVAVTGSFDGSL